MATAVAAHRGSAAAEYAAQGVPADARAADRRARPPAPRARHRRARRRASRRGRGRRRDLRRGRRRSSASTGSATASSSCPAPTVGTRSPATRCARTRPAQYRRIVDAVLTAGSYEAWAAPRATVIARVLALLDEIRAHARVRRRDALGRAPRAPRPHVTGVGYSRATIDAWHGKLRSRQPAVRPFTSSVAEQVPAIAGDVDEHHDAAVRLERGLADELDARGRACARRPASKSSTVQEEADAARATWSPITASCSAPSAPARAGCRSRAPGGPDDEPALLAARRSSSRPPCPRPSSKPSTSDEERRSPRRTRRRRCVTVDETPTAYCSRVGSSGRGTQNSLPSGSASTTHVSSPWPTSARRRAEREQALDLRVAVVGPEVEVQTVLHASWPPAPRRRAGREGGRPRAGSRSPRAARPRPSTQPSAFRHHSASAAGSRASTTDLFPFAGSWTQQRKRACAQPG